MIKHRVLIPLYRYGIKLEKDKFIRDSRFRGNDGLVVHVNDGLVRHVNDA